MPKWIGGTIDVHQLVAFTPHYRLALDDATASLQVL